MKNYLQDLTHNNKLFTMLWWIQYSKKGEGLFFVYGHGGTGKTYLYKTIIASLHSKKHIVLVDASSGISTLLLPGGRTAHSRFQIPINPLENATCDIKHGTQLAEFRSLSNLPSKLLQVCISLLCLCFCFYLFFVIFFF